MRKFSQAAIIFLIASSLIILCGLLLLKQFMTTDKDEVPVAAAQPVELTEEQFIEKIAPIAKEIADDNGLYPSVMIAQATLESNSGNSELSASPNYNLFGMKGKFNGESVTMPTLEDDGKGNMTEISADFRKYPDYEASMVDYANLLKRGTSWNKDYYTKTFRENAANFKVATKALTGRYATDSKYNIKLNAMIEQYDLEQYD